MSSKHYVLVEVTLPDYLGGNGNGALPNQNDMAGQVKRALEHHYHNGRRTFRTWPVPDDSVTVTVAGFAAVFAEGNALYLPPGGAKCSS